MVDINLQMAWWALHQSIGRNPFPCMKARNFFRRVLILPLCNPTFRRYTRAMVRDIVSFARSRGVRPSLFFCCAVLYDSHSLVLTCLSSRLVEMESWCTSESAWSFFWVHGKSTWLVILLRQQLSIGRSTHIFALGWVMMYFRKYMIVLLDAWYEHVLCFAAPTTCHRSITTLSISWSFSNYVHPATFISVNIVHNPLNYIRLCYSLRVMTTHLWSRYES